MGRTPCCVKVGLNRGPWTADEDLLLSNYVQTHGEGGWRTLPVKAGLLRCGKSCRLRWMNYLRPDVKRGKILPEEEDLILRLHRLLGNRWSLIAGRMPGRTDNEIKNYWNTHLSKKLLTQGINPRTHKPICATAEDSDISPNSPVKEMLQSSSPVCENLTDIGTSEKKGAAATEKGGGSTWCPQKNNVHESNSEALCVPVDISCINMYLPLPTLVKWEDLGMPYVVQQNLNDTDNVGSNQISLSPTSGVGGVAHHHGDNHSSFTTSFELSSYSSQSALWNSSDASDGTLFQKQQVSQGLQALEAELRNSGIVRPLMTASKKLSYMNCAGTASSFPYPNTMGSAFGDYSSDMFSSFLESFTEEELRLSQATSAPQPCPNQPDSANLSYDLWSLLSPSAQYHPLT